MQFFSLPKIIATNVLCHMLVVITVFIFHHHIPTTAFSNSTSTAFVIDPDAESRCREYAKRDHRGEMSKERWEYLQKFGDPNDPEFFYDSCMSNLGGKPMSKTYLK